MIQGHLLHFNLLFVRVTQCIDLRDKTAAVWPEKYTKAGKFDSFIYHSRAKQRKRQVKEVFLSILIVVFSDESLLKTF